MSPDVFISFSGRGGLNREKITGLVQNIKVSFENRYQNTPLTIWDQFSSIPAFDNYLQRVTEGVERATILLMVLDPAYAGSNEATSELQKYRNARTAKGRKQHIIKLVARRGNKEELGDMKALVSYELTVRYISYVAPDGNEVYYDIEHPEYKKIISEIAESINNSIIEESEKIAAEQLYESQRTALEKITKSREDTLETIRTRLAKIDRSRAIFVPVGFKTLDQYENQFKYQLIAAIKNNPGLKDVVVLPDAVAFDISSQRLQELIAQENELQKECIEILIEKSFCAIFPIEFDSPQQGERLYEKLNKQIEGAVENIFNDPTYKCIFSFNYPDEYANSPFKDLSDNAQASPNVRVLKGRNTIALVDESIGILSGELRIVPAQQQQLTRRKVYLITNNQRQLVPEETVILDEVKGTLSPPTYIRLDNEDIDDSAETANNEHNRMLRACDGIIVFVGKDDSKRWAMGMQRDVYNRIDDMNKGNVSRSMCVHPMQIERSQQTYNRFGFYVILNLTPDLPDFLNQL